MSLPVDRIEEGYLIHKKRDDFSIIPFSGAGGSRTRVQTHPPKAFYMFISALICRNSAGAEQTNLVRIRFDFHYTLTETMCTYPAMV